MTTSQPVIPIGKSGYTTETDLADHILLYRADDLRRISKETGDRNGKTAGLVQQILNDYGWENAENRFGRRKRIEGVISRLVDSKQPYGKYFAYTSESAICLHILTQHADQLTVRNIGTLADEVLKKYGWSKDGRLSNSRRKRIEKAIEKALLFKGERKRESKPPAAQQPASSSSRFRRVSQLSEKDLFIVREKIANFEKTKSAVQLFLKNIIKYKEISEALDQNKSSLQLVLGGDSIEGTYDKILHLLSLEDFNTQNVLNNLQKIAIFVYQIKFPESNRDELVQKLNQHLHKAFQGFIQTLIREKTDQFSLASVAGQVSELKELEDMETVERDSGIQKVQLPNIVRADLERPGFPETITITKEGEKTDLNDAFSGETGTIPPDRWKLFDQISEIAGDNTLRNVLLIALTQTMRSLGWGTIGYVIDASSCGMVGIQFVHERAKSMEINIEQDGSFSVIAKEEGRVLRGETNLGTAKLTVKYRFYQEQQQWKVKGPSFETGCFSFEPASLS